MMVSRRITESRRRDLLGKAARNATMHCHFDYMDTHLLREKLTILTHKKVMLDFFQTHAPLAIPMLRKVSCYGSFVSNTGLRGRPQLADGSGEYPCSDIDVTLIPVKPIYSKIQLLEDFKQFLQNVETSLDSGSVRFVGEPEIVPARVPIVHVDYDFLPHRDAQGIYASQPARLSIDVSVEGEDSVVMSQLFGNWAKESHEFGKMVRIVKAWFTAENLHGAKNQKFSSCAITFMVAHFFLVGITTITGEEIMELRTTPEMLLDKVEPHQSFCLDYNLAELLVMYFEFYANFNFQLHAIDTAHRHLVPRIRFEEKPVIIRSFDRSNTAHQVSDEHLQQMKIKAAFWSESLKRGKTLTNRLVSPTCLVELDGC